MNMELTQVIRKEYDACRVYLYTMHYDKPRKQFCVSERCYATDYHLANMVRVLYLINIFNKRRYCKKVW